MTRHGTADMKRDGKRRHPFIRCRRAAATAISAAVMTLMSIGGFALTSDHTHLVYRRDVLKAATDAASIAATRHWQQALGHLTDDDDIKAALQPLAKRYILANIPENRREKAKTTLTVTLALHPSVGMVDVSATADLSGGVIFAGWILDADTANALQITEVDTRTERIDEGGIIEVALAIDATTSMVEKLSGGLPGTGEKSRLMIVKQAAKNLVNILNPEGNDQAAIGLVPWHHSVRLGSGLLQTWEDNSWAGYPTERYYSRPYRNYSGRGVTQTLPATKPEAWRGCVDRRTVFGSAPPGLSAATPTDTPFTMAFYPHLISVSYRCDAGKNYWGCYSDSSHRHYRSPQFNCTAHPIVPLTTNAEKIKTAIDNLDNYPYSLMPSTYSPVGVVWARRLLTSTWRDIWGDAVHPVDLATSADAKKALVLLTDGMDNHPTCESEHQNRSQCDSKAKVEKACTAAKDAGILVFTVAALDTSDARYASYRNTLKACASDPSYAFTHNPTPEALEAAFQDIAGELRRFRRVY